MSTEATLEQPPLSTSESESDRLKASFDLAQENEASKVEAPAEEVKPAKVVAAPAAEVKEESIVPKELMGQGKKEEKKEEGETETDEELAKLQPNQPKNFEALRKMARERFDEIARLRKELKAKPSAPVIPPDVEEIKAKAKAAEDRATQLEYDFERHAYTDSPKFKRFGVEESAEIKSAKSYLEGTEVNPAIIDAAANTAGAERIKILKGAGLDAETIATLSPHLARVDSIRRERDQSLEGWKGSLEVDRQQQQAQQKQQEAQRIAAEKQVYTEVMDRMKTLPAFTRVEGNDKWNALVDQNYKEAEDFAHGRKPLGELFELGFNGVANRTTQLMNQELTKQLTAANTELARLKAAQPGNGSGGDVQPIKTVTRETDRDQTQHHIDTFEAAKRSVAANGFSL